MAIITGQAAMDRADAAHAQEKKRKRKKEKKWLKFLIWTAVVIIVIFLTLFLSSRIGRFDSIASMLVYIRSQF